MLYALLGVYDYFNYTKDMKAKYIFNQGILSLKNNLSRYYPSNGTSLRYDLVGNVASLTDHKAVCQLLGILYAITKEPTIKAYQPKECYVDPTPLSISP